MRWRPLTTFLQTLIDMKNAQAPEASGLRARLSARPRPFISAVFALLATPTQTARIERALEDWEMVRAKLSLPRASIRSNRPPGQHDRTSWRSADMSRTARDTAEPRPAGSSDPAAVERAGL
jgi:hypothetical protein